MGGKLQAVQGRDQTAVGKTGVHFHIAVVILVKARQRFHQVPRLRAQIRHTKNGFNILFHVTGKNAPGPGKFGILGGYGRIIDGRLQKLLDIIVHQAQFHAGGGNVITFRVVAHLYGHIADNPAGNEQDGPNKSQQKSCSDCHTAPPCVILDAPTSHGIVYSLLIFSISPDRARVCSASSVTASEAACMAWAVSPAMALT